MGPIISARLRLRAAQFSLHNAALLSLHSRIPPSAESLQQIRQSDQVLVAKEGSPGGDLYERVDASDIRTARHDRLQVALRVTEKHAILTPGLVIFDQLELATE
jgi:hypothetical protein